jgi:mono/diheme cytochrome c family protein
MSILVLRSMVALSILSLSMISFAKPQQKDDKKPPQLPSSDPVSGEGLYRMYCAVCHGRTGRGDGPAAIELKTPPRDLTTLARRHDGKTSVRNDSWNGSSPSQYPNHEPRHLR